MTRLPLVDRRGDDERDGMDVDRRVNAGFNEFPRSRSRRRRDILNVRDIMRMIIILIIFEVCPYPSLLLHRYSTLDTNCLWDSTYTTL